MFHPRAEVFVSSQNIQKRIFQDFQILKISFKLKRNTNFTAWHHRHPINISINLLTESRHQLRVLPDKKKEFLRHNQHLKLIFSLFGVSTDNATKNKTKPKKERN